MAPDDTAIQDPDRWTQKVTAPAVGNIRWNFDGQVVLVTGAARGQGRSHALSFARAGARVVLADMCQNVTSVPWSLGTKEELEQTTEECRAQGVEALPVICDVRRSEDVQSLVDLTMSTFGRINVLINNAGIYPGSTLFDLSEEMWDEIVDTDLKGVFLCSKMVGRHMADVRQGRIVSTGSTSSFLGAPHFEAYVAAKHGVAGLTKALAIDLAPYGITVNCVCPGGVYTPHLMEAMKRLSESGVDPAPRPSLWELGGPWSLFGEESVHPQDVSNAIMCLASDAARYITGQILVVDQGFSIK
jgi:NAD(P)-dependent dehydrogenase (short-subunit alcohol dehydrogenase family)